ncbi:MAG: hypothetical protein HYU66_00230 [Armatimonadetes bacterium]|nr:hypothetical protein [Armatimonadota bacterium]
MEQRERSLEAPPGGGGDAPAGGDNLAELRTRARRFVDLGRRATDRILSGDSEGFNRNVRQDGGQ